jgi:hypothetical protein
MLLIVLAPASSSCGASCPSYDDPAEAVRVANESPPEDCAERWSAYVCSWSTEERQERRARLEALRTKSPASALDVEEIHCGCLASTTDPCFVRLRKRGSTRYTFITTGSPGCEAATLPIASRDTVRVPDECGFVLSVDGD